MTISHLDFSEEVAQALQDKQPIVALESTIISHGMPYPQNVETALRVEQTVRQHGAVPATMAILGGRLKAGLSAAEIETLGQKGSAAHKVSRRDLAYTVAQKRDGATTVAATMWMAHLAGIKVFATGGIGGVHRNAVTTMDISADLQELAHTPITVVCAGAKSILDLGLTLEYLETFGVPVLGYQTQTLPAFFTQDSGLAIPFRVETAAEVAHMMHAQTELGLKAGMVVANPIPSEHALDKEWIDAVIADALLEAEQDGVTGKAITPFLLEKVNQLTGGSSLSSNIALVLHNAQLAAKIAKAYSESL